MARLLLGVSGGIAAYKALETARLAVKAGHAVRVIQSEASLRFVGSASFAAITGGPVLVSEFEDDPARGAYPGEDLPSHAPISHLALVERADSFLIAPATANTIAKLAGGHADSLLTAAALAAPCPVAIAPAMNNRMWDHPATRANVQMLRERGLTVIDPGVGQLASHGEYGAGRLAEPADLLRCWEALARPPGELGGVRVLVTAGGTREPIDSVRYLGNRSSGRMGVALAEAARDRGADVVLIAANIAVPAPPGVLTVPVETAAEMLSACSERFADCDVLLMAAAVADFRPDQAVDAKLGKDAGVPTLKLVATADVLATLAAGRRAEQLLVGFAAEHGSSALERARSKLERKQLDAVVFNDISKPGIGFDAEENEVVLLTRDRDQPMPRASKRAVAEAILDAVGRMRARLNAGDAPEPAARNGERLGGGFPVHTQR